MCCVFCVLRNNKHIENRRIEGKFSLFLLHKTKQVHQPASLPNILHIRKPNTLPCRLLGNLDISNKLGREFSFCFLFLMRSPALVRLGQSVYAYIMWSIYALGWWYNLIHKVVIVCKPYTIKETHFLWGLLSLANCPRYFFALIYC